MITFIWVMVILMAIEIFGKSILLSKNDFVRTKSQMIGDILIGLCLLIWGALLLGSNS